MSEGNLVYPNKDSINLEEKFDVMGITKEGKVIVGVYSIEDLKKIRMNYLNELVHLLSLPI